MGLMWYKTLQRPVLLSKIVRWLLELTREKGKKVYNVFRLLNVFTRYIQNKV